MQYRRNPKEIHLHCKSLKSGSMHKDYFLPIPLHAEAGTSFPFNFLPWILMILTSWLGYWVNVSTIYVEFNDRCKSLIENESTKALFSVHWTA